MVSRWLWPGNRTFLEVASIVFTGWIMAFCAVPVLKALHCKPVATRIHDCYLVSWFLRASTSQLPSTYRNWLLPTNPHKAYASLIGIQLHCKENGREGRSGVDSGYLPFAVGHIQNNLPLELKKMWLIWHCFKGPQTHLYKIAYASL